MKKIIRMIVFSLVALYLTTIWNQGFIISPDWVVYVKAALVSATVFYLIRPLTKLVLLPLNVLTLGLVGIAAYCLVFYFATSQFSLITIEGWAFRGYEISGTANIFVSAISVSTIINLLEHII